MSDHTEAALREALEEHGSSISPTPALPGILHRAARTRAPRRRWLPVGVAALASAGFVTGAVLLTGPSGTSGGRTEVPVAGDPIVDSPGDSLEVVAVEPGSKIPTAVYYAQGDDLVGIETTVTSTGAVGVDAVTTLFSTRAGNPTLFCNLWSGLGRGDQPASPVAEVLSVSRSEGVLTVDLDRSVADPFPAARTVCPVAPTMQQLVHTVTSALRTDNPVRVTVKGAPADTVFGTRIDGPVAPDYSVLAGIRPDAPEQGATVSSPVTVSGRSSTYEGNVVLDVYQDDQRVERQVGTFGSYEFAPYSFSVDLGPGEYTLKLFAEEAASGPESLAPVLYPVYRDITVE